MALDEQDYKILELLKQNSKLTTGKISKKLNIPVTTVHNRIKKLEKEGVITGYSVRLDHKKLGKGMAAFILATVVYVLPAGKKVSQEELAKKVKSLGAEEVSIVTGGTDLLIKVRIADVDELNDFIIKKLRNIDGIDKTQTLLVLSSY